MTAPRSLLRRRNWLALALAALAAAPALAQDSYPTRPIRILVGYSAGGGVDAIARMIGPRLSAVLGQQVVVENRAGAAGLIAGDTAAKAAPDGYTLLLGESGMLIAQHLQPKMPFDPIKSFTPVASLVKLPLAIVVNNDFPARTPKEFVERLRAQPAAFSYATSGVGTVHHLGFEMLKGATKSFVVHIPYRGASQIVPDVMSGQVPIGVTSVAAAIAQARAGKLRAIGTMSSTPVPGAEDIPPLAQAIPGFDAVPRLMLLAPAGTPAAIVDKLSDATRRVMQAPDLVEALAKQGAVAAYLPATALAADLPKESATWGRVVREQKITID